MFVPMHAAVLYAWLAIVTTVSGESEEANAPALQARLVKDAQDLLESPSVAPREVTRRCTSFVQWVYAREGLELVEGGGNVNILYGKARSLRAVRRRAAEPGDLVFFRDTYDRDRNGLLDDGLTHVGIVETVELDGAISFIHTTHHGLIRSRMDPRHPRTHRARGGEVRNDYVRSASERWPAALAGQLLAGFASARLLAEKH
jgi:hypothetical protein